MVLVIMTDREYVLEETSLIYMTDAKSGIKQILEKRCFISRIRLSSSLQMTRSLTGSKNLQAPRLYQCMDCRKV